ncbi:hypothetical protein FOCC_FOCC000931 [Frankliniella occidentalis]|nr:hypothetical protein FOCC_FOCC000931 [Frankliniella occidentalis]
MSWMKLSPPLPTPLLHIYPLFLMLPPMYAQLGWFAHPIFSETGDYPPAMKERVMVNSLAEGRSRSRLPTFTPEDVALVKGSADFFALNHYSSYLATPQPDDGGRRGVTSRDNDIGVLKTKDPKWPGSAVYWLKTVPWGFRKLLVWVRDQYGNPPLYVTENGFADRGEIHDTGRQEYLMGYLEELLNAIHADGVLFGMHAVNFTDPARPRTPKESATLFKQLTSTRRLPTTEEKEMCLRSGICHTRRPDPRAVDTNEV